MPTQNNYDEFDKYREYLRASSETAIEQGKQEIVDTIVDGIMDSAGYQFDATVNGESQQIVALRKITNLCKVTVLPGDNMYIGDLVYVFNEYWICMEVYVDEYGIRYAEIWMCNQIFNYQDHDLNIIHKYAIVDDGTYSKTSDTKSIVITDNMYTCYISLDEESRALYVDKRLALGKLLNSKGEEILEVGKIGWIDITSKNYGYGSHLMQFRLRNDVYNQESDDIGKLICNYIQPQEDITPETPDGGELEILDNHTIRITSGGSVVDHTWVLDRQDAVDDNTLNPSESKGSDGYLSISGRANIRVGTTRSYKASCIDPQGNTIEANNVQWSIDANSKITMSTNGSSCDLTVPLDDSLVGENIIIRCSSKSGDYIAGNKEVVVISIG